MPLEINALTASARIGSNRADSRLSEADIDAVAARVIEILERRKAAAALVRPDNSARSLLDSD